jgi:ribonuclease R
VKRREPRRTSKRRPRGRGGAGIDADRVVGALGARRGGLPATRLLRTLGGEPRELRALRRLLRALEREGRVERAHGVWRVPRADGLLEGELLSDGDGGKPRVRDDSGREHRIDDAGDARAGDRVLIAPLRRGRALLLQVVAGERDRWVGILRRHGKLLGIAPYRDDGDWFVRVARTDTGDASPGDVVEALPVPHKGRRKARADAAPWARIVKRLGKPGDADADFAAIVWRHRLPLAFPPDVTAEAEALRPPDARELAARIDLRDLPFVTIDPATARDHDDAVCVERVGKGFRLRVAIADVSRWVAPGSAIDVEALRRGNSVYFPDRAIPMLPERLSGDLCSLRPDVDRLVLVVELHVDAKGSPTRRRFHRAVIRSRARLSYEAAAAAMEDGDEGVPEAAMLRDLADLSGRMGRLRRTAGALDFEIPSVEFRLDEHGVPVDAQPAARNTAHRAIEEAMLAANRAVAEWLVDSEVEAVHRIHDAPSASDCARLVAELTALGFLDGGDPETLASRDLARGLARAADSPAGPWVHQLALRSMKRAHYGAESKPHYALAFEHYLHFTSPIRRYADLAVHRALAAALAGERPALSRARAEAISVRTSYRERVAMAADREMAQLKACVLLRDHVGERHRGRVTGVAPHGLYVTLDRWWVEGLVHVSRLPDHFDLDESGRALVSRGGRYELGDRVAVTIADADPVTARIDFALERRRPRRSRPGA